MQTHDSRIGPRARLVRAIGCAALGAALASCQLGDLLHAPNPASATPSLPSAPPPTTPPQGSPPPTHASRLGFTSVPAVVTAGVTLSTVQVRAETSKGDVDTAFTGTVEVALTDPTSATLLGTRSLTAVRGVAAFTDLSIQRAGSGYRLAAQSSGIVGAESAVFDVLPGAPAALQFAAQPQHQALGAAITPDVQVVVVDRYSNLVTDYARSVTMAIGVSPTLGLGQLHGTRSVTVVGGHATFADLSIDVAGLGYTLVARAGTLATESNPFNVGP